MNYKTETSFPLFLIHRIKMIIYQGHWSDSQHLVALTSGILSNQNVTRHTEILDGDAMS